MKINLDKNSIALLLIRIVAGCAFLVASIAKLFWTTWGIGYTASGDKLHSAAWTPAANLANGGGGILHSMFTAMGTATWTAPLVIAGELLIGISVLIGLTTRIAASLGALEAALFWLNSYMPYSVTHTNALNTINQGVLNSGWGGNSGPFNDDLMLVVLFLILAIFGAGALKYSVAGYLNKFETVKKNKILQLLVN